MDDNAPKEDPPQDLNAAERRPDDKDQDSAAPSGEPLTAFNKIDLSQLQGFSFGTQWTQDKSGGSDKGDRGEARTGREDRRGPGGDGPADRRDRRAFRRPEGAPAGDGPGAARPAQEPGAPRRREFPADARARPDPREFRGGPRAGGERAPFPGGRGGAYDRAPYDSPYFSVTFYPEDTSFAALVKTIRASCRTIELFEIARTVLGKPERFSVLVTRKDPAAAGRPAGPAPAATGETPPAEAPMPAAALPPLFISGPDGLPFESEGAAVSHVIERHLKLFFDLAEVEVEPPKGNFQVINRCGMTGELLGPPNYHRYAQIVQQHYTAKAIRLPFDAYRARIETVRDPEVVNQWLEKMKKVTRYTWKGDAVPAPSEAPAAVPAPAEEPPAAPATAPAPTAFDSFEEARAFLLSQAREKPVRASAQARFHGRELEFLPPGEIRRAIEGTLERQRRFPLDTANALRGRLRREHFTIFKKGAKGVSYVCAVKRKFRVAGQTFAESIGTLIAFIEAHPMVKAGELVSRILGGPAPAVPGTPEAAAGPADIPTVAEREKIGRLQGDLLWLVREGYVTEFIDGTLYAPPPMAEARKKEVEREEHDPENFPEPAPSTEAAAAAEIPPAQEAPAPETKTEAGEPVAETPPEPAVENPAAESESPPSPA